MRLVKVCKSGQLSNIAVRHLVKKHLSTIEIKMTPENTIKIILDIESTKKLQSELPSKLQVLIVSIFQFIIGCSILSLSIQLSNGDVSPILSTLTLIFGVFLILLSTYTFFVYYYRKNHLLLLEALVSKNGNNKSST